SDTLVRILVGASLRVSLVAVAVGVILVALRARAPGLRHGAWTAVLVAMLLMPILPYCVAPISIPLSLPARRAAVPADPTTPPPVPSAPPRVDTPRVLLAPVAGLPPSPAPMATETPLRRPAGPSALLVAYGIGVLVLLWRLRSGWRAAARGVRGSRQIPADEMPAVALWPGGTPVDESNPEAIPGTT